MVAVPVDVCRGGKSTCLAPLLKGGTLQPPSVGGLSQRPPSPGFTSAGPSWTVGWGVSCWSSVLLSVTPEWLLPPTLRLASMNPLWEPADVPPLGPLS